MKITAKMQVSGITTRAWGTEVELACQYDQTIPEDQRFYRATPSGSIKMNVDNPVALKEFTLGRTFYIHFEEAPPMAPTP